MAINLADNTPRIEYTYSNIELVNAIVVPFVFFNGETDLKVYIKSTIYTTFTEIKHSDLATGSNPLAFTVASGGDGATGTILIRRKDDNATYTLNGTLVIQRVMAIQRVTDYQPNGPFEIATLNLQLDQLTAIAGDLRNAADRTLQIGINDFATNVTVPNKADRIGRVLGFHPTTGDLQMYTLEDYTLPVVGDNGTFSINSALQQSLTVLGGTGIDVGVDSSNRRLTLSANIDATSVLRSASTFEQSQSSTFPSSSLKGISVFHAQDFLINFSTICIKPDQTNIETIFGTGFTFDGSPTGSLKIGATDNHYLTFTPTTGSTSRQTFDFYVADLGAAVNPIFGNPVLGDTLRFAIDLGDYQHEDAFDEKIKFLNLRSHNGFNGTAKFTVADQFTERDVLVFRPTHNSTNEVDATFSDDLTVNKNLTIGGEIVGNLTVSNNVTIDGNLTVNGTTTTVNTATLSVQDPLIALANGNNSTDSVDIGFYGLYDSSGSQNLYAGMYRDATDDKFKLFKGLQTEPSSTVNISGTGYTVATLVANIEGTATSLSGVTATSTELNYNDITTLGTVQASKTVTADANGDVKFSDIDKLRFGTGNDLTIHHEPGFSIIREENANPIFIQTDNTQYGVSITKKFGTETMAKFIPDGAVTLYYNGLTRFFTSATGVEVVGTLTGNVTGDLTGDVTGDLTGNVIGDVTGITSVLNTNLVVGRDADTEIDFSTNNSIKFKANTTGGLQLINDRLYPLVQNQAMDLGYSPSSISGFAFRHGFFTGTVRADELETTGGIISVKNDGSQSEVRLYCEFNNNHYVALQAPAHSSFSGNATVTLPSATGTLISTSNSDAPTTTTSSSDADFVLIDDGGTMKKITPSNLGIGSGSSGSTFTSSIELHNALGYLNLYDSTGTYGYRISGRQTTSSGASDSGFLIEKNGGEDILRAYSSANSVYANQFKIMRGTLELRANNGSPASFKMYDSADTGSPKYIEFLVPSSGVNNTTITLPTTSGTLALTSDITGGGGGSLTIQDEGSNLATDATTLNFVGSGVVASGTGATKTITISGSSGGGGTTSETYGASLAGKLGLNIGTGNIIVGSSSTNSVAQPIPSLNNTGGEYNTVMGSLSGNNVISSDRNTLIGAFAGQNNTESSNNTSVGYYAGRQGYTTGLNNYDNTSIGYYAFSNGGNCQSRQRNTSIGAYAGNLITTGDYNISLGYSANPARNSHSNAVTIGTYANGGLSGVSIGYQAGQNGSIYSYYNNFVGYRAGWDVNGQDHCNYFGFLSGYEGGSGNYNNGVGSYTLRNQTNGHSNTVMGHYAGYNINTGDHNVGVGYYAGEDITTGTGNVCIGSYTGSGSGTVTGSYNVMLGWDAEPASSSDNWSITLGNSSITSLRCNVQSISSLSDQRDKTSIEDLDLGLDFINAMRPVSFAWNRRDGTWLGRKEVGFIAQELHEVEMDFNSTDKTRLVSYADPSKLEATPMNTYPILVKAIQELSAKVDSLQTRITELEGA